MKIDAETLKKQVILHLPYILFLLVFAKLGEAVRLAPGADASQKLLGLSEAGLQSDEAPAYLFQPCRTCRPSGVFLYPRGDRQFGGCTFDDRADDALFLLRHV